MSLHSEGCARGCPPFQPGDAYCAFCGRPATRIHLSLATERPAGEQTVQLTPGGLLYLDARNTGQAAARVELDVSRCRGLSLLGAAVRRVAPGQALRFELRHDAAGPPTGQLGILIDDHARAHWWERRATRRVDLALARMVRLREERWVIGSPVILLPPAVRRQLVRIWNDAESERSFQTEIPGGWRASALGADLDRKTIPLGPGGSIELSFRADTAAGPPEDRWELEPGSEASALRKLEPPPGDPGPDAVVAIDFGTRNTGVRVRWRRALVQSKPVGTVDAIGDRGDTPRFPTQMVLHLKEQTFRWGAEAAQYVAQRRLAPEEVAVDNLKTYLRDGQEPYAALNPNWTVRELLRRYVERILLRLDAYFREADPEHPLDRRALRLSYVLCRPVLDFNEDDAVGSAYTEALVGAMESCGVDRSQIRTALEPAAAAIGVARRRGDELAHLSEGEAVAVVDSGGGTSHIALARVRLRDGRVDLEVETNHHLVLDDDNPALEAIAAMERHGLEARREVGGNVLDTMMAFILGVEPQSLLDTEGKPPPRESFWRSGAGRHEAGSLSAQTRLHEILAICRRLKERFAHASTQFLNRAPNAPRVEGEVLPFPNRADLEGVYLVHDLYDLRVLRRVLDRVIGKWMSEMQGRQQGIRLSEIRSVFYVGGTCIDPFARRHFGRAFPGAAKDLDRASQSPERIDERLNCVVEGAVWHDERLYPQSSFGLELRFESERLALLEPWSTLLPLAASRERFHTTELRPGQELSAELIAHGGMLDEALTCARGFYRNDSDQPEEVTLSIRISRDRGCEADLITGDGRQEQWRVFL